jgi:hypothetical protein
MRRSSNFTTLVAAVGLAAFSAAPRQTPDPAPAVGENVLCALAIYSVLAEASARCAPDKAPEAQAELRRQIERLDAHALANGMTAETLAAFKAQHAPGPSDSDLCEAYRRNGLDEALEFEPGALRTHVDDVLARPGAPTLGDCL